VGLVALVLIGPTLSVIRHDDLLTRLDTRTEATTWIEQNIPAETPLLIQWFGPALSVPDDPEPGTRLTYEVVVLDPFQTDPAAYELSNYLDRGIQYFVVNSFNWELTHKDASVNAVRQAFYQRLAQETELVAEFRPEAGDQPPTFVWEQLYGPATGLFQLEQPGPTIRIYKTPLSEP
jgi:hypothetical protein